VDKLGVVFVIAFLRGGGGVRWLRFWFLAIARPSCGIPPIHRRAIGEPRKPNKN
jgi:hypothetical protein